MHVYHKIFAAFFLSTGIIIFLSGNTFEKKQLAVVVFAKPPISPMPTEIDPNFERQVRECFLPMAALSGYDLRITSGFRSRDEQEQLFAQGREVPGHIVTLAEPGKSIHNFGFAVDVVDRFRGYDINWEKLGKIGAYCGLEEGDNDYNELAHFQNRQGLRTRQLKHGVRPQPLVLPCQLLHERAQAGEALTRADLKVCGAPLF